LDPVQQSGPPDGVGSSGIGYENEDHDEYDFEANQIEAVIDRQAGQGEESPQGVAFPGGVHSTVKIGQA